MFLNISINIFYNKRKLSEIKDNRQYCLDKAFFLYYYANSQKTLKTKKPRTLDSTGFTAYHPGLVTIRFI